MSEKVWTKAQWRKLDVALDRLDRIHDCDPAGWTARVSTPGFDALQGIGLSRWTCGTCQAMVADIIRSSCGGVDVKQSAA